MTPHLDYDAARAANQAALAEYHSAHAERLDAKTPRDEVEAAARLHVATQALAATEAAWYAAYEAKRLADRPLGEGPVPGLFF